MTAWCWIGVEQKDRSLEYIEPGDFLDQVAATDDSIETGHHQNDDNPVIVMTKDKVRHSLPRRVKVKKISNMTELTVIPTPSSMTRMPIC